MKNILLDLKKKWHEIKFSIRPFKCEYCDADILFKFPIFTLETKNGSLVIIPSKNSLCRKCLSRKISNWFAFDDDISLQDIRKKCKCFCCDEEKICSSNISSPNISFTLDNKNIWCCESCLTDCVDCGDASSCNACNDGFINEENILIPFNKCKCKCKGDKK